MPWHSGTAPDKNGKSVEYEALGYQTEIGARVEIPADPGNARTQALNDVEKLMKADTLTGVLIVTHPKGDPEASRHFWVHNPMGGNPADWLRHIRIAIKRYQIDLST